MRAPTLQPQHRGCPVPRHKRRCSGQRTVLVQSVPLHAVSVRRLDLCRRKLKAIGPLPLSFAAISGSLHGPGLALVVSNRSRPLSSCQGGLEPYSWVVWRCRRSLYHLPSLEQGCTGNNNLGALCSGWYCSTFSNCGRSALVRYLLCGASRAKRPAAHHTPKISCLSCATYPARTFTPASFNPPAPERGREPRPCDGQV